MNKKTFFRTLLVLGCLIISMFFCTANFSMKKSVHASKTLTFDEYSELCKTQLPVNDYSSIKLNSNVTYGELMNALNVEIPSFYSTDISNIELSEDDVFGICEELEFDVNKTDFGYEARSIYQLKKLFITGGKIKNTYNATSVVTGYEDITILAYETIEDTKYAYEQLSKDPSLNVVIDFVVSAKSVGEISPDVFTLPHYSWGYITTGVEEYIDYLGSTDKVVVVAVLDTGINTSHEMFRSFPNNIDRFLYEDGKIVGHSEYSTAYTYSGYNFEDDKGHGTHVAGTICDLTPQNVKIVPVKVLNNEGRGDYVNIVNGIKYVNDVLCAKYNVVAMNMSLGGNSNSPDINTVNLFDSLRSKGCLPVCAAGNDNTDRTDDDHRDASKHWPANCSNGITVTALEKFASGVVYFNNNRSDPESYSFYGSVVDISAPGTNIMAAYISKTNSIDTDRYVTMSGTSMATPHVSAVISLLCLDERYWINNGVSYVKNYTCDNIETRLKDLAEEPDPDFDDSVPNSDNALYYGAGILSLKNFNGNITVSASEKIVTYDGNYHNINLTISGPSTYTVKYKIENTENYYTSISDVAFNNAFKNVTNGKMKVYYLVTTTEAGYTDTIGYTYLTISPRNMSITINNKTSSYGDETLSLNYTITSGSFADGENESSLRIVLKCNASKTSNAGTYEIIGEYSNRNYNVTFTNGTYTISKATVTVTIGNKTGTYGDAPTTSGITATASGLKNSNTIADLNLVFSINNVYYNSAVGTYTDTIDATYSSANYNVNIIKGNYIIEKRNVTLALLGSSIYGETPTISDNNYSITSGSMPVSAGITLSVNDLSKTNNVGVYENKISLSASNINYNITTSSNKYEITKRPITIDVQNRTITYGDSILDNNTLYTISSPLNVVNGDNLNVDLVVNPPYLSTGTFEDCITGTISNESYSATFNYGDLTISKKDLKIAINQSGYYGDEINLDPTNYTLAEGYSFVGTDTILGLTLSTTATKISAVGEYDIYLNSYTNPNYNIDLSNPGILKYLITRKPIDVFVDNKSGDYGDSIKTLTYVVKFNNESINPSGLLNFNIQVSTTATNTSPVGEYPIQFVNKNENYEIKNYSNGIYKINHRTISISLDNKTSTYGDPIETLTYRYLSGSFAGSDNINSLGIIPQTSATSTSSVNTYDITATLTNSNYVLAYVKADYTITKRSIVIRSIQTGKHNTEIVLTNDFEIINGSLASCDTKADIGIEFETDALPTSPVGTYTLNIKNVANANYDVKKSADTAFKIVGNIVKIKFSSKQIIYGDPVDLSDIRIELDGGSYPGVTLASLGVLLKCDALYQSTPSVNTYEITAECSNPNYALEWDNPGILTIKQREITIKSSQRSVYGYKITFSDNCEVIEGSLVNNDSLGLNFRTNATETSNVGSSYSLELIDWQNKNYNVTYAGGSFSITPRSLFVAFINQTSIYGDALNNLDWYISFGTLASNDTLEKLKIEPSTNATPSSPVDPEEDYFITGVCKNNNYNVTFTNATYTIIKRVVTLKINQFCTYGEEVVLNPAEYTVIKGTIKHNLGLVIKTTADKNSSIGKFPITLEEYNPNYTITLSESYFEIKAKEISITIENVTKEYGENLSVDDISYTINDTVTAEVLGLTITTDAITQKTVGVYEIYVNKTNINYTISHNSALFKITPVEIEILSYQYITAGSDITLNNQSFELVSGTIFNDDDLGLTFETNADINSPVGKYNLTLASYLNKNYIITLVESSSVEVVGKSINITIKNIEFTYGSVSQMPKFEFTVLDELLPGDTIQDLNITLETLADINSPAGTYLITGSFLNPNYGINFTNGNLKINPKTVYVDIKNASSTYLNELSKISCSLRSGYTLVGDDELEDLKITFETKASSTSPAGTYLISGVANNKNYKVIFSNGVYTINKKPIEIKILKQSSVYGEKIKLDNSEVKIISDLPNDEILEIVLKTDATSSSNVGKYKITATTFNPNFTLSYDDGEFEIEKRKVTIKLHNKNVKRFSKINLTYDDYDVVDGTILSVRDFTLKSQSNIKWFSLWGGHKLSAICTNENYDVEVISSTANLKVSFVDGLIIFGIVSLLIGSGVIVLVVYLKRRKMMNSFEHFGV